MKIENIEEGFGANKKKEEKNEGNPYGKMDLSLKTLIDNLDDLSLNKNGYNVKKISP